jgi:hypothetical protein
MHLLALAFVGDSTLSTYLNDTRCGEIFAWNNGKDTMLKARASAIVRHVGRGVGGVMSFGAATTFAFLGDQEGYGMIIQS